MHYTGKLLFIGVFSIAFPATVPSLAEGRTPTGRLKFDKVIHDFGGVVRGGKLSHRFTFTNAGAGPLVIHGVHAACGCTAAEVDTGRIYQSGEAGAIEVTFDTASFSGRISKTVSLMTNEALAPGHTLTVSATVNGGLWAEPPLLDFGDVFVGVGAEREFQMRGEHGHPADPFDLKFNKKALSVVVDGSQQLGWRAVVKLLPQTQPGFLKETVIMSDTGKDGSGVPVLVRANIVGSLSHQPSYLEFGPVGANATASRVLTLFGRQRMDIFGARTELRVNGAKVKEVEPFVRVLVDGRDVGGSLSLEGEQKVNVELKNVTGMVGSVHGKIFFQTADAAEKEMAVDFYAFFL